MWRLCAYGAHGTIHRRSSWVWFRFTRKAWPGRRPCKCGFRAVTDGRSRRPCPPAREYDASRTPVRMFPGMTLAPVTSPPVPCRNKHAIVAGRQSILIRLRPICPAQCWNRYGDACRFASKTPTGGVGVSLEGKVKQCATVSPARRPPKPRNLRKAALPSAVSRPAIAKSRPERIENL